MICLLQTFHVVSERAQHRFGRLRVKIKAGFGITGVLMVGCRIKYFIANRT